MAADLELIKIIPGSSRPPLLDNFVQSVQHIWLQNNTVVTLLSGSPQGHGVAVKAGVQSVT